MTKITVPYGYKNFDDLKVGNFFQYGGSIFIKTASHLTVRFSPNPVVNAVNLTNGKAVHFDIDDTCFTVDKMTIEVENDVKEK